MRNLGALQPRTFDNHLLLDAAWEPDSRKSDRRYFELPCVGGRWQGSPTVQVSAKSNGNMGPMEISTPGMAIPGKLV
jgi:hypothetical protein